MTEAVNPDRTTRGAFVESGPAAPSAASLECFHDESCQLRLNRYQERLRALALELSLTAQRERRRIAMGLHDQIGQRLAAAKLGLEAVRRNRSLTEVSATLDEVTGVLAEAIQATRELTFELSPPLLYELGLKAALDHLAQRCRALHGIACALDCDEDPQPLPNDSAVVMYEVARELLHNVVKHACAKSVRILMTREGEDLHLEVMDDGIGFEPRCESVPFDADRGFGLFSARERVRQIGGTLVVHSAIDQGTRVVVIAPLATTEEGAA